MAPGVTYTRKENVEMTTFLGMFVTHLACFGYGLYKGANPESNNSFEYFWLANSGITGTWKSISAEPGDGIPDFIGGAVIGGVAAPLEYLLGYGIGKAGSWLVS